MPSRLKVAQMREESRRLENSVRTELRRASYSLIVREGLEQSVAAHVGVSCPMNELDGWPSRSFELSPANQELLATNETDPVERTSGQIESVADTLLVGSVLEHREIAPTAGDRRSDRIPWLRWRGRVVPWTRFCELFESVLFRSPTRGAAPRRFLSKSAFTPGQLASWTVSGHEAYRSVIQVAWLPTRG